MPIAPIPPATARVAHAVLPIGNRELRRADELATRCTADAFLALFPPHGPPALPPWRLALVPVLHFAAGLSDRQAAEAGRRRIDWQDGLRLERTAPGFDASVLRECRGRLIAGAAAYRLFDTWLAGCRTRHLVKARGRPRPDSAHSLAAVRALNRLAVVGETRRHALNSRAVVAPAWVRAVSPTAGRDRDVRRAEDDRLPTTPAARAARAWTSGHDGWRWLSAVDPAEAPPGLREIPAVTLRRRGWLQNSLGDGTQLQWRATAHSPPAAPCSSSPDAAAAPEARTHTPPWVGSQGHRTATGADARPQLMPTVDPTIGPAAAGAAPPRLHAARQRRARRPRTQLGDPGFLDAQRLVDRQADDGVDVLGPTRLADHGQARAGAGLDAQHVQVDWEHRHATGPAGKTRRSWTPAVDTRENPVMQVKVSSQDCRRCDHVTPCIRPKPRAPRRTLTIRPQPPYQALQTARQREATEAFQAA